MTDSKVRAPRNRTLTLNESDRELYGSRLKTFSAATTSIENTIFNNDLMEVVEKLPASSVDLLFLDPPYNLTKDYGQVKFQKKSAEEYETWFRSWFVKLLPILKPSASVYVCCDWRTSVSVYNVMSEYLFIRNRITWEREKGRGALDNWKNCSEDIWYGTVDKETFEFNVDAVKLKRRVLAPYTKGDGTPKDWDKTTDGNYRLTYPSNLWTDISIPFWSMPENTDHPTQKPEKLVAKIILASTKPGDMVFDPFMGSGTTAVVAKKLGRKFSGVEVNPEFCLWALKRLDLARDDREIQGYIDGVFWERNSGPDASKSKRSGPQAPLV